MSALITPSKMSQMMHEKIEKLAAKLPEKDRDEFRALCVSWLAGVMMAPRKKDQP